MNLLKRLLLMTAVVVLAAPVQAADRTTPTTTALGTSATCSRFANPMLVRQMGTGAGLRLRPGGSLQLSGPEPGSGRIGLGRSRPATAKLFMDGSTLGFRDATIPINFAIIRSGLKLTIIRYPSDGVISDQGLQIFIDGQIDELSLCYGIGLQIGGAPVVPVCPSCAANAGRTLMCTFDLNAPKSSGDASRSCCICNNPTGPLKACDPNAVGGQPNACIDNGTVSKTGLDVPTTVEFNNDPYVCNVSGGVRTCYKYGSP